MLFAQIKVGEKFSIYPHEHAVVWTKIQPHGKKYIVNASDDDGEIFFEDDRVVFPIVEDAFLNRGKK